MEEEEEREMEIRNLLWDQRWVPPAKKVEDEEGRGGREGRSEREAVQAIVAELIGRAKLHAPPKRSMICLGEKMEGAVDFAHFLKFGEQRRFSKIGRAHV